MSSTMTSRRLLGCLLLVLLSQYAVAKKSYYLELISTTLQRIENILAKHEPNTLNCIVPFDKLFNLLADYPTGYESNERKYNGRYFFNPMGFLDIQNDIQQFLPFNRQKDDINSNVNQNTNTNINDQHRRTFSNIDPRFFTRARNQNVNSNVNLNKNNDLYVVSEEDRI